MNDERRIHGISIEEDNAFWRAKQALDGGNEPSRLFAMFKAGLAQGKLAPAASPAPLNISSVVRRIRSALKAEAVRSQDAQAEVSVVHWGDVLSVLHKEEWAAKELEKEGGETKPDAGTVARRILDRAVAHSDITTTIDGQTVDGIAFDTLERIMEEELGEQPAPTCDICEDTGEVPYYDHNGDEMDKRPCPHCKRGKGEPSEQPTHTCDICGGSGEIQLLDPTGCKVSKYPCPYCKR